MTHAERKALREKHYSSESFECCTPECMADDCLSNYPCDVIKVLDYLDLVDPMPLESAPEINWAGGK